MDTTRADALHAYGNKDIATPNLDSIATDGVMFRNNISQVPLTLPSHACILTGSLPSRTGVRDNNRGHLPADQPTIAALLKAQGYETAAFVSSIVLDHRFGLDRGFDTYDDHVGPRQEGAEIDEYERVGEDTAAAALNWLQGKHSTPFFLFIHFYDPHAVYHTHPKYSRFGNPYYQEIAYVDEQVGRILEALKPLRDRTLIVLTADHGEGLGQHEELSHGLFLYDSTIHVPLMMSGPGLPRQKQIATQTRSLDILPTLLALAGIEPPSNIDGRSLVPLIQGKSWNESDAISESRYGTSMRWSPLFSVRNHEWKYVLAPKPELYHLANDPAESKNVVDEYRAVAFQMQKKAQAYRMETRAGKEDQPVDAELQEKLKSLGYVSGGAQTRAEDSLVDPKDKLPVYKLYEQALFAFYDGKQQKAVELLQQALKLDDSIAVLYDTLARLGYRANTEKQIEYLRKAAALEPDDPVFHHKLATCYRKIRQYESSVAEEDIALRFNPRDIDSLHGQGTTYLEMRAPQKAIVYFQKVLEIDPQNAPATHQLGSCYRLMGDMARAEQAYRKSMELNPNLPDSFNALGVILAQEKKYDEAIALFQQSIRTNPGFSEAYFNLGMTYQRMGRNQDAAAMFRKFIDLADPADYASRIEKARRWIESQS